ncbi:hypothetical protein GOV13_01640 [Candidatus Pacearchaeota archaeon]|nr:hypothetical protein [Candidatus Pacearchaeota archaeon]
MFGMKVIRGHHVREWYFDYLRVAEGLPQIFQSDDFNLLITFPITVVDTTDDACGKCRDYPAINFCRGEKLKREDIESRRILGLELRKPYDEKEIHTLFRKRNSVDGILRGKMYDHDYLIQHFLKKSCGPLNHQNNK